MNIKYISTLLFFFVVNVALGAISDPELRLLFATSVGILQTICMLIAVRNANPLELFTMSMLLWMVQLSLTGLLIKVFELPLEWGATYGSLGLAANLANLCQLIVAFVWKLPSLGRFAGKLPKPSFPNLTEATGLMSFLWVISLLVRSILIFSGYQAGFDVEAGNLTVFTNLMLVLSNFLGIIPIIYFCCLVSRKNRSAQRAAKLVFAIEVILITFFAGTKAGPVILIVNFAIAYHYMVAPIKAWKTWTLILCSTVVVIPFYVFKLNVRRALVVNYAVTQERPKLTLNDYLNLYTKSLDVIKVVDVREVLSQTSVALVNRMDVLSTLAATITHYEKLPAYDTEMYLPLWIKPYIPRFIWPDKGAVGLGLFVTNEILGIPNYTQAAVTSTIEGYIAGGLAGAFILSIIHGLFVSLSFHYFNGMRSGKDTSFLQAYFVSSFLVLLYFNYAFAFFRAIISNLIFLWVIFKCANGVKSFFAVITSKSKGRLVIGTSLKC